MNVSDDMMLAAIKAQIPNLKTQAQFNTFMSCFDALKTTLNAYFGAEYASAEMAREALSKGLEMAKQVSQVTSQLEEMSDDVKSEAAKEFTSPAKELHEYDVHRQLIGGLDAVGNIQALQQWYNDNRDQMDRVISQRLRNELFDAIRVKRAELVQREV